MNPGSRTLPAAASFDRGAARGGPALALAALAALLASACCVLPLVLVVVGISGAWIGRLRVLEPYSSWLAGFAVGSLAFAAWRLFRPGTTSDAACGPAGSGCVVVSAVARRWFWLIALLTLVPLLVPLAAPFFY